MGKDTCKETHVEFSVDLHRHAARDAEGDYVGGHVECLQTGIYRNDLPIKFRLVPEALQGLLDKAGEEVKEAVVACPAYFSDAQRAALMQLFEATNGQEWTRSDSWNTSAPVREWFGVSCDDDGHVIRLNLLSNSLRGPLPPALANLTRMVHL